MKNVTYSTLINWAEHQDSNAMRINGDESRLKSVYAYEGKFYTVDVNKNIISVDDELILWDA